MIFPVSVVGSGFGWLANSSGSLNADAGKFNINYRIVGVVAAKYYIVSK
ncbi:hypothetical protein [Sphingorhabdus sp. YGSMI21]|nr:hypothetical protein [Sphingorhabdus sp. YGSMI21]